MKRPWTRGADPSTHPHGDPAPGAPAPRSRSGRPPLILALLMVMALFMSCASPDYQIMPGGGTPPDAETRALAWMRDLQESDGSFPTDSFLPREIGTAMVMGLLAATRNESVDVTPVLAKTTRYVESRQSPDGAFRVPNCPDVRLTTSLALLALFAVRDRNLGFYRSDGAYVEACDPRLLSAYVRSALKDPLSWDEFLERRDAGAPSTPSGRPEPEDFFLAARRSLAAGDGAAALEIRARVLEGQSHDGFWEVDGPSEGRRIVGAAYRIRTLNLLCPLLADTLVRK